MGPTLIEKNPLLKETKFEGDAITYIGSFDNQNLSVGIISFQNY